MIPVVHSRSTIHILFDPDLITTLNSRSKGQGSPTRPPFDHTRSNLIKRPKVCLLPDGELRRAELSARRRCCRSTPQRPYSLIVLVLHLDWALARLGKALLPVMVEAEGLPAMPDDSAMTAHVDGGIPRYSAPR